MNISHSMNISTHPNKNLIEQMVMAKLRCYISADILKTIYYALFGSHMRYACQIWGQSHSKTFDMIPSAQNKALRIINFKQWNCVNLYNKTSKYMREKIISY